MDRSLVEQVIAGDREAYTELVRQSIDRSYAVATLVLRDPEWPRDATQDAYVNAWRDLSSLRDPTRSSRGSASWSSEPATERPAGSAATSTTRSGGVDGRERSGLDGRDRPARPAGARVPQAALDSAPSAPSTTTSASPWTRSPRPWASRWGPPSHESTARRTSCAPPSRPTPAPRSFRQDRWHDGLDRIDRILAAWFDDAAPRPRRTASCRPSRLRRRGWRGDPGGSCLDRLAHG